MMMSAQSSTSQISLATSAVVQSLSLSSLSSSFVTRFSSTASPSTSISVVSAFDNLDDVPEIIVPLAPHTGSRSTSKQSVSSVTSSQTLFTISNIAILVVIAFSLITITIGLGCFCARDSTNSGSPETKKSSESKGTSYELTDHSTTENQTNNGTTMIPSNYGISIPGYMLIKYGVSVRPKKEIARGGFGRIMLGEALDLKHIPAASPVIIKEMLKTGGGVSQKDIESFYQEVSIMSYLVNHRNIATLYGYTEQPYTIVMKFYPLGSLETWLYSKKERKSISQIFYFALDIASGLEYMWNKGFCHSDLKPQNVLIDIDDSKNEPFCVLTDFGITQIFSDKSLLVHSFKPVNINGASLRYAAPEAILKLRKKEIVPMQFLPKFDIYSYVIILYELVCRTNPFN